MCGRYDLDASAEELAARFGVPLRDLSVNLNVKGGWRPRYNIAPSQHNPVVVRRGHGSDESVGSNGSSGENRLELMWWGLVPAWSREPKVAYSTINARAETVASKPAFRKPLSSRRCLVPATGYFEWAEVGKGGQGTGRAGLSQVSQGSRVSSGKQPFRIRLRSKVREVDEVERVGKLGDLADEVFAFAGLYDIWRGPGGEELKTYTIVTTRANDALIAFHSRMPVILPRDLEGVWLNGDDRDIEELVSLLQPYPEELTIAYPVSCLVSSLMNDGRELIEPLIPPTLVA